MSKWLCTICHLLGAFLLYHIYSIISWRDFKNHVKNRFWQSEIDFLQPRWGALETVSCKLFYFPDVKTRAQRSCDQSETELYPGQRLCATPPPHAELFASCACAEDAPVSSCSGFALVQGRLSRSCGMDLIVTAWPATETVLQHHHDVGTIALQYAIHNLPHNIKWVRPSNQMSVRKKFFFLQRSVCHWREIQDASIFIFSIIWTSLSSK